ncbi:MAG TPA: hypothetical protein VJP45_02390, partial [Candidatus Limnocylindria bacterium]|nr:hypothetical protein [Candidatus Limnocylindria bacterium]
LAALLVGLGAAVLGESSFAREYVREELSAQKITFTTADKLTDVEKNWKPGSACLVTYAGQQVETGAQAECFAKYYLAVHMDTSAKNAGFPGATYATLGPIRTELTAQVNAAKAKGDTTGQAEAQKKLDAATSLRSTMQTGETLRGLLLTVYGFSVIGEKAALAGNIIFGLAALMIVLSVAGFIHAYFTPKDEVVLGGARDWSHAPTTA